MLIDCAESIQHQTQTVSLIVTPAQRPEYLPLSYAQQRLWFIAQMDKSANAAYIMPNTLKISGELNIDVLQAALNRIVARHEILRTRFIDRDGEAIQYIDPENIGFTLRVQAPSVDSTVEASSLDLVNGPVIEGYLTPLSPTEHRLHINAHHLVSDGWSEDLLIRELSILYDAYAKGLPDPLPPLPVQYADYAIWQRQWLSGDQLTHQKNYWHSRLKDAPTLLELPTDFQRPAEQQYQGASVDITLDATLTHKLKTLSQKHGTTLFMTILTGWSVLMARLSGQNDVVVGIPFANRNVANTESLIGMFVNTLAIRTDIRNNPLVSNLLTEVRKHTLDAQANQDLPFEQLVELLEPPRSMSFSPIFQTMFVWQNVLDEDFSISDLDFQDISDDTDIAQFDLTLSMQEDDSQLKGSLNYATSLFTQTRIEQFVESLKVLLDAITTDDSQAVLSLPIVSQQQQKLVGHFNETSAEYPEDTCLHELFEKQVAETPDAISVVYQGQSLTYQQLNQKANQLAHWLIEHGVTPDSRVAVALPRSQELLVSLLAVLKSGGAYVPLDPGYPTERLQFMLEDSNPVVFISETTILSRLNELQEGVTQLLLDDPDKPWQHYAKENIPVDLLRLTPRHLAYVIYTSGSTGKPKGVMNEHRGVVNRLWWMASDYGFSNKDVFLQKTPFSFDVSVWELFSPLCCGAKLVIAEAGRHGDPEYLIDLIEQTAVSVIHFVPPMLQTFLRNISADRCLSLRQIFCSGEALPAATVTLTQHSLPQARISNLYGPTEAAIDVTAWDAPEGFSGPQAPIGSPVSNTEIYILDAFGQPVPVGVIGEIFIGGVQVARGYLNRPELTEERFIRNPFVSDITAKMYKTGDQGRWLMSGDIEYSGRNDDQVKIRGFRIELEEIRTQLLSFDGTHDAIVVASPTSMGELRLTAYYTSNKPLKIELLKAQLSITLPEHMVPAVFIYLTEMPLTPNGKIDRKALPEANESSFSRSIYQAPVGTLETQLADIWRELLDLEKISRHDNFFELGGHSLLAVRMSERVRRLGFQLPIRSLFQRPVLKELASALEQVNEFVVPENRIPAGCTNITPDMLPLITLTDAQIRTLEQSVQNGAANIQDIYPLTPLQEGIFFQHQKQTEGDDYIIPTLLEFDSRERLDHFLSAMRQVIKRHDILRTSVAWEGLPEPVQIVWREAELSVEELVIDKPSVEEELIRIFDLDSYRIDIRQAPMIQAKVCFDAPNQRWLMYWLCHHLIEDVTTLQLMLQEVQAYMNGQEHRLPPSVPFRQFVAYSKAKASDHSYESFFRKKLGDIVEPTNPFGLTPNTNSEEAPYIIQRSIPDHLGQELRSHARRLEVSVASVFHLVWGCVLREICQQNDVVFGTVLTGRMSGSIDIHRALGLFINTLPIRISLTEMPVEHAIKVVNDELAELIQHEHAPLILAQQCSGLPATSPLVTTILNYRNVGLDIDNGHEMDGIDVLHDEERTEYPISLSINDHMNNFTYDLTVDSRLNAELIAGYLDNTIQQILNSLESNEESDILQLKTLPEDHRNLVLYEFNNTKTAYPRDQRLDDIFQAQAERHPDAVAVRHHETLLTYKELDQRANHLSQQLSEMGLKTGSRVALFLPRSIELILCQLAILKAGCTCVPLDVNAPESRTNQILQDCGVDMLISERANLTPEDTGIFVETAQLDWHGRSERAVKCAANTAEIAYIMYTSGSTGKPKGVQVPHRGIIRLAVNNGYAEFDHNDVFTASSNPAFDASTFEYWACLLNGSQLVIIDQETLLSAESLTAELKRCRVTVMWMTVGLFHQYVELFDQLNHQLRYLLTGGDVVNPQAAYRVLAHSGTMQILNCYGPTECSTFSTAHTICLPIKGSIPIGRPIANTRIYLLNNELNPVPIGTVGEVFIAGDGVARGYLNKPELTGESFLDDPFCPDNSSKMYRSGDLGRWLPDGRIEFLGRNDQQVKIRGFRIEPGDIASHMLQLSGVEDAYVTDRKTTSGETQLIAFYTGDQSIEKADIRQQLSLVLPNYMLPSAYVYLESLPLTTNGKINRKALPDPTEGAYVLSPFEAPEGATETLIAELWQTVLGIKNIGRYDNFFESGGHSLSAVRLMSLIREKLELDVPVSELFANPSLAAFSVCIAKLEMAQMNSDELDALISLMEGEINE
ncbi:amino acid adenylation domain-containing protein [Gynuella sp.]|uniref:amino acid adenylation domain-containing protein n=1 Tax=Gynuella sp. TaxID=2969146 RepID=UPI003D123AF8